MAEFPTPTRHWLKRFLPRTPLWGALWTIRRAIDRSVARPRRRLRTASALAALAADGIGPPARVVGHGSRLRRSVALTFDDNREPEHALATLAVLQRQNVRATLFVTGDWVEQYPEITREIARGGHEIGDHSLSHAHLKGQPLSILSAEVGAGVEAFKRFQRTGASALFRPPFGDQDSAVRAVAGQKGYPYLILWDVDPRDWEGHSAQNIEEYVSGNVRKGSIVLLHLSAPHTAAALPEIIGSLRARGFQFVTVSEMLRNLGFLGRLSLDGFLAGFFTVLRRRWH